MIKAVFIDIDDTLINSQRELTVKTRKEIKRCTEKGIKIILASGRSRSELIKYQEDFETSPYIISSNGSSVFDISKNKEIYTEAIEKNDVHKLLEYAEKNQCTLEFNYEDKLVVNKAFYPNQTDLEKNADELNKIIESENIVQCVILTADFEKILNFKKYFDLEFPNLKIINESKRIKEPTLEPKKSYFCDIASTLISKGNAVEMTYKYFGISNDEIVVIGDGENDISMFEKTPNSVAMGNALPYVKEKAKYVTSSNDDDGVAKVLERL